MTIIDSTSPLSPNIMCQPFCIIFFCIISAILCIISIYLVSYDTSVCILKFFPIGTLHFTATCNPLLGKKFIKRIIFLCCVMFVTEKSLGSRMLQTFRPKKLWFSQPPDIQIFGSFPSDIIYLELTVTIFKNEIPMFLHDFFGIFSFRTSQKQWYYFCY